ncbi:pyridoxine/pyridoxamine 5'-phosphate oxidase-like [Ciona intestinalis]
MSLLRNVNIKCILNGWKDIPRVMSAKDICDIRKPYKDETEPFLEVHLESKDPIALFGHWFEKARATPNIDEPNSMTLATVKSNGRPAARTVLMKGYDQDGFRFFTNYRGAKAHQIKQTPFAALVFYWPLLCRSVRVEGTVEKLDKMSSDEYFNRRPRANQIAAHVSQNQSAPVSSRQALLDRQENITKEFEGKEVTRPDFWGGYVVQPDLMEFWQGQGSRMSDRIVFTKKNETSGDFVQEGDNGWVYKRLEP